MKIERLLDTIIYLVNHEQVSASELAKRFSVSVRTVQRDICDISLAGIPIYAVGGRNGGYAILPSYKMNNAEIRNDEQAIILKALESLATSYSSTALNSIIEKYNAILRKGGEKSNSEKSAERVFWDFGVTKENADVQNKNAILEKAISQKNFVKLHYKNSAGKGSDVTIEPLAIHYKWYAWYLFAFVPNKKSYRTFKVARIQKLSVQKEKSKINHCDIKKLMSEAENEYYKTCINIEVHFDKKEKNLIQEYFPVCPIENIGKTKCRIFLNVPPNERLWKALLLSFGDRVKVIRPKNYRDDLIETAKNFLNNYDIQLS